MTVCRSCHAPIVWATTTTGERIPVDYRPAVGGNIRLGAHPVTREMKAVVVGATIDLFDPRDDGTRYVSHFVTCPDAGEWRT